MVEIEKVEDLLRDKHLYLNVVLAKKEEAKFFLDLAREKHNYIHPFRISAGQVKKTITHDEKYYRTEFELCNCASAFFNAMNGFFDSLAIYHTKNRLELHGDIAFKSWLDQHKSILTESDSYINFLSSEDARWIATLRKNRKKYTHRFHVYQGVRKSLHIFGEKGKGLKAELMITELEGEQKELMKYMEEIYANLEKLADEVDKNIEKEYEFVQKK